MTGKEIENEAKAFYEGLGFELDKDTVYNILIPSYVAGAKMVLEKWRSCYLSCSSPYCAFPDVEVKGVLGRLEKGDR